MTLTATKPGRTTQWGLRLRYQPFDFRLSIEFDYLGFVQWVLRIPIVLFQAKERTRGLKSTQQIANGKEGQTGDPVGGHRSSRSSSGEKLWRVRKNTQMAMKEREENQRRTQASHLLGTRDPTSKMSVAVQHSGNCSLQGPCLIHNR